MVEFEPLGDHVFCLKTVTSTGNNPLTLVFESKKHLYVLLV